ncbi:putative PP2C [Besnoitia besnoiti]|uniref:Putative PP2C n=1 Tax=Besnoitia besnoiti TaxID=94643 RepID=A0A2A9MLE4_BESBE|nr:putative PP2C [Besnoitia besnoiti]PFH36272.1 putative PP2C [Besnoitia besnoiti]
MPHLQIRRSFRVPGAARVFASLTKRSNASTQKYNAPEWDGNQRFNHESRLCVPAEEVDCEAGGETPPGVQHINRLTGVTNSVEDPSPKSPGSQLQAVAGMAENHSSGVLAATSASALKSESTGPFRDSVEIVQQERSSSSVKGKASIPSAVETDNPSLTVTRPSGKTSYGGESALDAIRPCPTRVAFTVKEQRSLEGIVRRRHTKQGQSRESRRAAAAGKLTSKKERPYQEKARLFLNGEVSAALFVELGIATSCRKGLKKGFFNQDDFFAYQCDEWGLYGVFDGHGPGGHLVANFVQWHLPNIIHEYMITNDPKVALYRAFIRVNAMLKDASEAQKFDSASSGSTASVVLHRREERKLFFAHVGDSRIVLARRNSQGRLVADCVTKDHKPDDPTERARIERNGGEVRRPTGHIPHRVFLKGKNYPGLAMSRSIGDSMGHCAGVTPEPDVSDFDLLEDRDEVVIMCTDGVWEFITPDEVVEIVSRYSIYQADEAAQELSREAWRRWLEQDGHSVDDITVQIIHLFPPAQDKDSRIHAH